MLLKPIKKKIAHQLTLGFMSLSIISSLVMGLIFLQIFYSSHLKSKVESLLSYGYQLAQTYEVDAQTIEIYDQLLDARIWILSKGSSPMISGQKHQIGGCSEKVDKQCQIKGYDTSFINQVYEGKEVISKLNKTFYYGPTLSLGIPITKQSEVVGAVLIHAPLKTIYEPIQKAALYLVIGIMLSTLLTFILARYYAHNFTSSIRKIRQTASLLIEGDYKASSQLKREDELGDLSHLLDELASKLQLASEESHKLEQIRRDFVANVSHEFRTPLTVIRGNAEGLMDHAFTHPEVAYDTIYKETLILQQLVSDLLDLSRLQQGKLDVQLESIYLPDLIEDAKRSMKSLALSKALTLTTDLDLTPVAIESDYLRLRQIIIILLDNAIKYTPSGGAVHMELTYAEGHYCLTIADTGIGISPEDLPYIWDRFYKVDRSGTSASTGIGLSIAKNLMELLNIPYTVKSTPQEGTTFTLSL